jgi:hypothetical protein
MHNHDIIFDVENKRIGMVEARCNGLTVINNITYIADNVVHLNTSEYAETCGEKIKFYTTVIMVVATTATVIIGVLAYGLYRLRKKQKFLWMRFDNNSTNGDELRKN